MKDKFKGALIAVGVIAVLATGGAAIAGATGGGDGGDKGEKETPITGSALDRASQAALKEVGSGKVTQTEAGDEEGAYEVEVTKPDGSQVDVHLDKSFAVIDAEADKADSGQERSDGDGETGDGPDKAITGAALDRAGQAALKKTGGGKVTETEQGDEDSYYEVEVTKADGSQVDVQLDKAFNVVGSKVDHEDGD